MAIQIEQADLKKQFYVWAAGAVNSGGFFIASVKLIFVPQAEGPEEDIF